jgi:hypothetical protein
VAHLLYLLRISRSAEALCQIEEGLFSLFLRFQAKLDQFHENTVVAKAALLGDPLDLFSDLSGKRYTSSNLFCVLHLHQYTPLWCNLETGTSE